ncbi:unnamed protein product [Pseudo-nitzschia multistriata]|uniref:Nitric oxide synthase-interacting protein zinc-finger domain-containing protein n=1 Tax=Pseudo-nitzschia multistriata TaxID=183589 RepID=A0A448ZP49_9STRA|nr:unnamed protein product [Pseudo-nitzschia multistriata]
MRERLDRQHFFPKQTKPEQHQPHCRYSIFDPVTIGPCIHPLARLRQLHDRATAVPMARKSKQPGGHNPLTAHERKKYAKDVYGTTTARLGRDSQYSLGDCGLSLHPARDHPVASPSGYIYERSAMLEYLLAKTRELKQRREEHDRALALRAEGSERREEQHRRDRVEDFERTQKVASAKRQKLEENVLKRTSYWLADMQPSKNDHDGDEANPTAPLPKRPPSPNTQRPLRRKDLIELCLLRKHSNKNKSDDGNNPRGDPVLCAISEKEITTQQALALVTTRGSSGDEAHPAQVVLESVYRDLKIEDEKTPVCPVTGRKLRKVLKLQRGGSSFASEDGRAVEAKQYRPTMT